jgi:hypothetical protein
MHVKVLRDAKCGWKLPVIPSLVTQTTAEPEKAEHPHKKSYICNKQVRLHYIRLASFS